MSPILVLFITLILGSVLRSLASRDKKGAKRGKGQGPPLPPGPAGLPILGNLHQFGPKPHRAIHHFSRIYGPLMRLRYGTSEVVVVSSASVADQFFRAHDVNFSNRPFTAIGEHLAFNYQDLAFTPYGPRWRTMRKLLALHLFAPKPLNDLRPVRESEVSLLVHSLRARSNGGPVDMAQALNVCITNALSRSMFSQRVFDHDMSSGGESAEFKEMVFEFFRLCGVFFVSDFMPSLRWVDVHGQSVVREMKSLQRRFELFFDKVIERHSAAGLDGDLLSALMRSKDAGPTDGVTITDTSIKALLLDLFTAGTDTSSASIEWALTEMIRHPDLLRKAQEEIDAVVGRDRLVCEADLPNFTLIQAIIKETFRLHPPAPLSVPRMSFEACEVNGYSIPKHTTMLLNIWGLGRDPSVWPSPLEFRPERFLPGGANEHAEAKGNEMLTFGGGRRVCVGYNMGMRMVKLTAATLVHAFDWGLPEGQTPETLDMEETYGLTSQREVPLRVHPTPRLAKQAYESIR